MKDYTARVNDRILIEIFNQQKNMKRYIYFIGLCVTLIVHSAYAEFSESEEQRIRQIIRGYLYQNPDVLYDLILDYSKQKTKEEEKKAISLTYNSDGDGRFGNPNASVVIYEYSDYNCGYCKRLFKTLQALVVEDSDILVVIKEFPILSQSSVLAAKAALAAEEQNKFLEYHLNLMTSVGSITEESLKFIANKLDLDMEQFNTAISSDRLKSILRRNINAGRAIGIEGTPALLIGDKIIPGAISLEEIKALVHSERNKK